MTQGIVAPVLPYCMLNFTGITSATGPETLILADNISIPPYARIGLSLRRHRLNALSSATLTFDLRSINPSAKDGADFLATTVLGSVALTGPGGTGVGAALLEFTSGNGFSLGLVTNGPHPMARLTITASSSIATVALIYGVFSADLVLRSNS
jgi:hypothetical protein